MAFGRQVHDRIGLKALERLIDGLGVADVGVQETIVRPPLQLGQRGGGGGVGERVQIKNLKALTDEAAHHRRADEARTARDEDAHQPASARAGKSGATSRRRGAARSFADSTGASVSQLIARSASSQTTAASCSRE